MIIERCPAGAQWLFSTAQGSGRSHGASHEGWFAGGWRGTPPLPIPEAGGLFPKLSQSPPFPFASMFAAGPHLGQWLRVAVASLATHKSLMALSHPNPHTYTFC